MRTAARRAALRESRELALSVLRIDVREGEVETLFSVDLGFNSSSTRATNNLEPRQVSVSSDYDDETAWSRESASTIVALVEVEAQQTIK
jgi:hypothetical protein